MSDAFPDFRGGNVLSTRFTGTRSERYGTAVERVPTPQRLFDWLQWNDLAVASCTTAQLESAWQLREAIHTALTAAACHDALPPPAVHVINDFSTQGRAAAVLTARGTREWRLDEACVEDALSVVAADAVSLTAGQRNGRLALCESPTCRAAFLDSSQSRTRRWCDMNTCGNRHKKARFRANRCDGP